MAVQDYLTLSHLRKVIAAITQRIVGVENSVSNVENDVSDINGAIEELRNDKEVFVITAVRNYGNISLSATYKEIENAHKKGKICILIFRNFQFSYETVLNSLCFKNEVIGEALILHKDNTVEVYYNSIDFDTNGDDKYIEFIVEDNNVDSLKNQIFNHVSIYVRDSSTDTTSYYADAKWYNDGSSTYISGTDSTTGDTVIFTQPDSSVNEWTKTVRSAPYIINITDRNSATTLVSDKSPSEISDVYYSEKPVFAFIDASTVPTGQYQLSDIIDSPTESAVVFNNGFCEIKVTETQIPAAVAEIGGKYSCEYTYIGIPNDIDSAIDGQILTYDDTNSMWVNSDLPSIPTASSTTPSSDGTGAVGVSTAYARADHVHPKITQSLSISSNVITLTGSDGTTSSVTLPVYNGGVSS